MRSFTVQSGRATLACEEQGSGPVVLALHAGVADRRSWRAMGDSLGGFRLVAYDRRGFGETTYEPEPFSHLDDLHAVVEAIDATEGVALLGNSMGGSLAIDYALEHPDRVRALVLIAPAVSGWPELDMASVPEDLLAIWGQAESAEKAGDRDLLNRLYARLWLDGPGAPEGRVVGEARDLFLEMNGLALQAQDPGDERTVAPAWERLEALDMPLVVALGDLDEPITRSYIEELVSRAPRARLVDLPGVAHLPQMEQPEAVAALVREVVASG